MSEAGAGVSGAAGVSGVAELSELTGLDQVALERAGGPMDELTDKALNTEIDTNRRAEYRLVGSALICLLAITVLLFARWMYLG